MSRLPAFLLWEAGLGPGGHRILFRALSESRHRWSLNVEAGPDRWRDELLERPAPVFQVMLSPVTLLISNRAGG